MESTDQISKITQLINLYRYVPPGKKRKTKLKPKKKYIKKTYPPEFGPDGVTIINRGPWSTEERKIYFDLCEGHREDCRVNRTKALFQEIMTALPTRNLLQVRGFHTMHNPYPGPIIIKEKRIRKPKEEMKRFRTLYSKNKKKFREREARRFEKRKQLLLLGETISSQSIQILEFNSRIGKKTLIHVFINQDLQIKLEEESIANQDPHLKIQTPKKQQTLEKGNYSGVTTTLFFEQSVNERIYEYNISNAEEIEKSIPLTPGDLIAKFENRKITQNKQKSIEIIDLESGEIISKINQNQLPNQIQTKNENIENQRKILESFKLTEENEKLCNKIIIKPESQQILLPFPKKVNQEIKQPSQTAFLQQLDEVKSEEVENNLKKQNALPIVDTNPQNISYKQFITQLEQQQYVQPIIKTQKCQSIYEESNSEKKIQESLVQQSQEEKQKIVESQNKVLRSQSMKLQQQQIIQEQQQQQLQKQCQREQQKQQKKEQKKKIKQMEQQQKEKQKEEQQKEKQKDQEIQSIKNRYNVAIKPESLKQQQNEYKIETKQNKQNQIQKVQQGNTNQQSISVLEKPPVHSDFHDQYQPRELRRRYPESVIQQQNTINQLPQYTEPATIKQEPAILEKTKQVSLDMKIHGVQEQQPLQKQDEQLLQQQPQQQQMQQFYQLQPQQMKNEEVIKQQMEYAQQYKQYMDQYSPQFHQIPQQLPHMYPQQMYPMVPTPYDQIYPQPIHPIQMYPMNNLMQMHPYQQFPPQILPSPIAPYQHYQQQIENPLAQQEVQTQDNKSLDQYRVEMMYVYQEVPQNFDPNFFFQFSPTSFEPIPQGSQLGGLLKK